jgi:hypothetical protein
MYVCIQVCMYAGMYMQSKSSALVRPAGVITRMHMLIDTCTHTNTFEPKHIHIRRYLFTLSLSAHFLLIHVYIYIH